MSVGWGEQGESVLTEWSTNDLGDSWGRRIVGTNRLVCSSSRNGHGYQWRVYLGNRDICEDVPSIAEGRVRADAWIRANPEAVRLIEEREVARAKGGQ